MYSVVGQLRTDVTQYNILAGARMQMNSPNLIQADALALRRS